MTDTTQTTETTQEQGSAAPTTPQASTTSAPADAGKKAAPAAKAAAPADAGQGASEGAAPDWHAGLPDDLKGEKSVLRHATLEDAIRAGLGAEKRLGVPADQLIRKPSKPEEYADVYRALGAPEKAEDYNIGLPDKANDADKALAAKFGLAMFEKGPFPHDFVKAAVEFINGETLEAEAELEAAQTARKAEGEAFLKKELGAVYDPEMKAVGKLLLDLGGEELASEFDASGHGDNPRLMLAFQKVVERLGESGALHGNNTGTGAPGQMTPGQAKAARLNLENDPVKGAALMDNSHSMHKSVLEERRRLIALEEGMSPNG